jgi:ABC-type branched-subunit amino acid transport system ATPase component
MALLSVRNVTKRFDGVVAVDGVSFEIGEGDVVGVIGPNGSGKTTLINLITGIYRPSQGEIRFRDEDIAGRKLHEIARKGIARTFQNIRLFDDITVMDNVLVGADRWIKSGYWATVCGRERVQAAERGARRRARDLLAMMHGALDVQRDRLAGELPYADKRRLEIVRALSAEPKLLLLDEPAAGMSPSEIRDLVDDLRRLANSGITILLVEHKMRLIEGVTERVIVLDHGKKIADDAFGVVRNDPHVIEAYLGSSYADAQRS